jgi:hypothetical protein
MLDNDVALTAQCDLVLWHKRFGHLNLQSLHAHMLMVFLLDMLWLAV